MVYNCVKKFYLFYDEPNCYTVRTDFKVTYKWDNSQSPKRVVPVVELVSSQCNYQDNSLRTIIKTSEPLSQMEQWQSTLIQIFEGIVITDLASKAEQDVKTQLGL